MNNNGFQNQSAVIVNGFCTASPDTLGQIKDYFGLRCDVPSLIRIQRHYGMTQRRDPTSDELIITDRFLTSPVTSPEAVKLTSLSAYEAAVGEAYDDLRAKLSELEPPVKVPLSLSDIFYAGERCLNAVGKKMPSGAAAVYSGSEALIRAALSGSPGVSLVTAKTFCSAVTASKGFAPDAKNADCLIYLTAAEGSETSKHFAASLAALIINSRVQIAVKTVRLTAEGFLQTLLSVAQGAYIDLNAVLGYGSSPAAVTEGLTDGALVITTAYSAQFFAATAQQYGFEARFCGRAEQRARLTLVSGNGYPIMLSTDFLRSQRRQICCSATVGKHDDVSVPFSGFAVSTMTSGFRCRQTALADGQIISVAETSVPSYRDAALTVLEAVSRVVAAGAEYEKTVASFDAKINCFRDNNTVGDSVAVLLGLYRAQTELCLLSGGSAVSMGENVSLGVTVTAKSDTALPDILQKSGSRMYLLSPRTAPDGLPDFRDVRLLFAYVNKMITERKLLSAYAVGRGGISEATDRLSAGELKAVLGSKLPFAPCGSFVVETDSEPDGVLLGQTE